MKGECAFEASFTAVGSLARRHPVSYVYIRLMDTHVVVTGGRCEVGGGSISTFCSVAARRLLGGLVARGSRENAVAGVHDRTVALRTPSRL